MDEKDRAEMARMIDVLTGRTSYGPDTLINTGDAALVLMVSEATIKRWSDAGHFPSIRTPGGHRKIRLADLAHFAIARTTHRHPAVSQPTAADPGTIGGLAVDLNAEAEDD